MTQATCLPASAALDQRFDERRVVADAIGGHLHGHGFGIGGGGGDEALHAVFEAFVGMMHQHVAGANGREDVGVGFERGGLSAGSTARSRSAGTGRDAIWNRVV